MLSERMVITQLDKTFPAFYEPVSFFYIWFLS
jgi:hypothetical protein